MSQRVSDLVDAIASSPSIVAELELRVAAELLKAGKLDEAQAHLQHLTAEAQTDLLRGNVAAQWLVLGRARARRGDPREAETALRQAVLLGSGPARVALAQQLTRDGHTEEAISLLREAITAMPQDSVAYTSLLRIYEQRGDAAAAVAVCLQLVEAAPSMANTLLVASQLEALAAQLPQPDPARTIRIALLGNATLEHLHSYIAVACFAAGLRPVIYQAGFDQYTREILDPSSALYAFAPDVVILAVHPSRIFPRLHEYPFDLSIDERRAEMDAGLAMLRGLLDTLTERSSALVLLHNAVLPQYPALGLLDARDDLGQTAAFSEINLRLAELARSRYRSVYIVDEERVQARTGKTNATDARAWLTARSPWSGPVLKALTDEYLRYIRAARGLVRKCIVVDLDNTLWGGVVGEDGIAGLQLGSEAPGNAFVAFQRELDKLWRRGVLLAICSKNNPKDAFLVVDEHPDMVLKRSHFAAERINWEPKAANLREMAAELNIGIDSLVFLDDNPVERAAVRAALPQVLVPELPRDPAEYRRALLDISSVFDTLALTAEDRARNKLYMDQRARREAAAEFDASESLDAYLADLGIVVEIDVANELTLPRIAQLTGKTNQFNLTTRRYTEADVLAKIERGARVYGARVRDRFGDNGLTGVLIAEPSTDAAAWRIDTLLLSCRVMGRAIETALLAHVAEDARRAGAFEVRGSYIPTEKNSAVRDCYPGHGFRLVAEQPDGETTWSFQLDSHSITVPSWLQVRSPALASMA